MHLTFVRAKREGQSEPKTTPLYSLFLLVRVRVPHTAPGWTIQQGRISVKSR
jgi:hypothetical protein